MTFQDLNVTENVFLGHTRGGNKPFINWKAKYEQTEALLSDLGVNMHAKDPVRGMSVADQQMIEITSALSQNAKVIIMDEPTAALFMARSIHLFKTVNRLKEQGKAIVFIGHRLEEIMEISDRITVLRDGEVARGFEKKDVTQDDLVQMMVGRTFRH